MREQQQIKKLKARGWLGPICPRCHSPLGSATCGGGGYQRCRACRYQWNCRAEPIVPLPYLPVPPLSDHDRRQRDLRYVYWHDRLPYNLTTRMAMRRNRRKRR